MNNKMNDVSQPIQTVQQSPTTVTSNQNGTENLSTQKFGTSKWVIIAWLIFFPPVAWYYMWKEKKYHSWFAAVLLIYAVFSLILQTVMVIFILPQLASLYQSLGVEYSSVFSSQITIFAGIAITLAQIMFALYLRKRVKQQGSFSRNLLITSAILLIFNFLIPSIGAIVSYIAIIQATYNILNVL